MVPLLAIPALTFRDAGGVDLATTTAYAQRAAATWISTFLLSGTTAQGLTFSVAERAEVLDLWLQLVPPERLLACCWEPADVLAATIRGVRPLVVMRGLASGDDVLALLAKLPAGAYVYSHPLHTPTTLDADLVARARAEGVLPLGAKITKIPAGALPDLRAAAGEEFDLWDGSARNIVGSLAAGASGVFATPLTAIPEPFPEPGPGLQGAVDAWQARLDAVPEGPERAAWFQKAATCSQRPTEGGP